MFSDVILDQVLQDLLKVLDEYGSASYSLDYMLIKLESSLGAAYECFKSVTNSEEQAYQALNSFIRNKAIMSKLVKALNNKGYLGYGGIEFFLRYIDQPRFNLLRKCSAALRKGIYEEVTTNDHYLSIFVEHLVSNINDLDELEESLRELSTLKHFTNIINNLKGHKKKLKEILLNSKKRLRKKYGLNISKLRNIYKHSSTLYTFNELCLELRTFTDKLLKRKCV